MAVALLHACLPCRYCQGRPLAKNARMFCLKRFWRLAVLPTSAPLMLSVPSAKYSVLLPAGGGGPTGAPAPAVEHRWLKLTKFGKLDETKSVHGVAKGSQTCAGRSNQPAGRASGAQLRRQAGVQRRDAAGDALAKLASPVRNKAKQRAARGTHRRAGLVARPRETVGAVARVRAADRIEPVRDGPGHR